MKVRIKKEKDKRIVSWRIGTNFIGKGVIID